MRVEVDKEPGSGPTARRSVRAERDDQDEAVPAQHLPAGRGSAAARGPRADHARRHGRRRGTAVRRRPDRAPVVRATDGDLVVTDGPFAEGKEHIGGFWIIRAADLDGALGWARRATVACRLPDRKRVV